MKRKQLEVLVEYITRKVIKEGDLWKFITGHSSNEDKQASKSTIEQAIQEVENYINTLSPAKKAQLIFNKQSILKAAQEDNFRGRVEPMKDPNGSKIYIIYRPKMTGLQHMGQGAASGTNLKLMGNY